MDALGKTAKGLKTVFGRVLSRVALMLSMRAGLSCTPLAVVAFSCLCHTAYETMTGPACSFRSSSDAPICASLLRAASAKSSPLMHAWVTDNHPWTCAGCPSTQRPYRRPPHPRGLRPHRRFNSMSPARASFGLLRFSQGRHHRMLTKCLACEACVHTC